MLLGLSTGLWGESEGTLHGELVRAPQNQQGTLILYVENRDGNVWPVVATHAVAEYGPEAAPADRVRPAGLALLPGTEVRVTAELDASSGEWTASKIEVIPHHAGEFEQDYGDDLGGPAAVRAHGSPQIDTRRI